MDSKVPEATTSVKPISDAASDRGTVQASFWPSSDPPALVNAARSPAADLRLSAAHLADLRASGLSDKTIRDAGLHTEFDLVRIHHDLGWRGSKDGAKQLGSVMAIPYFDAQGRNTGYKRFKPTTPRTDKKKPDKVIKYEAPARSTNRAYFPPGIAAAIADPNALLTITEGEKKALKATQEGVPTIGLSGVWNWQKKRPKGPDGKGQGYRFLLPELEAINWAGRAVDIVFDSDAATNPSVWMAAVCLKKALTDLGAHVRIVILPPGPLDAEGKPGKVGLDDFLVAHGAEAYQLLAAGALEADDFDGDPSLVRATIRSAAATVAASQLEDAFRQEFIDKARAAESWANSEMGKLWRSNPQRASDCGSLHFHFKNKADPSKHFCGRPPCGRIVGCDRCYVERLADAIDRLQKTLLYQPPQIPVGAKGTVPRATVDSVLPLRMDDLFVWCGPESEWDKIRKAIGRAAKPYMGAYHAVEQDHDRLFVIAEVNFGHGCSPISPADGFRAAVAARLAAPRRPRVMTSSWTWTLESVSEHERVGPAGTGPVDDQGQPVPRPDQDQRIIDILDAAGVTEINKRPGGRLVGDRICYETPRTWTAAERDELDWWLGHDQIPPDTMPNVVAIAQMLWRPKPPPQYRQSGTPGTAGSASPATPGGPLDARNGPSGPSP